MLEFVTSPLGQILGWLFGAISLPLAIYFYLKQKIHHCLSYDIFNRPILRPTAFADIRIFANYGGHEAPCLVETIFLLRNSGNQTIKAEDIFGGVQFRSHGTVLGGRLLVTVSGSSNPAIELVGSNGGQVCFNFLRPGDGLLVSVLHTDPQFQLDVWAEGPHVGDLKYQRVKSKRWIFIVGSLLFAILLGAALAAAYRFFFKGDSADLLKATGLATVLVLFVFLQLTSFSGLKSKAEKAFFELMRGER
jgi:hypothetical protein